ncbi:unnamed protein product [Cylindrotheca closterium]|uniref:Nucleoporin Nup133/Nup155-like N-terminal domain-containing protein n=1 Tax=Cylindrotheca closterium TaxID=2856 RepID=A0AAD2FTX2_9STRA|nr:unnamed protein product [Cylindrotheca closterium]
MSMTAGNNSVTSQSDYWNDDFLPLRNAGKSILKVLRSDETSTHGDLYRRILSTTSTTSNTIPSDADPINHHYFSDGKWKHAQSMPLPSFLQEKLAKAKQYSMMGLFPEAELAWLTIDDSIYLWTFTRSADGELLYFQVPSQQPIVSVFRELVEWCLVVTTKEEAMLCALARKENQALSLIRTRFVIPSDFVSFISITSTKAGRIFLGGQDGNLYELDYDLLLQAQYAADDAAKTQRQLDSFYDASASSCPEVLVEKPQSAGMITTGKRVFASVMGARRPPRKCQRIDHSKSTLSSFLPDYIEKLISSAFSTNTTTGGGPIKQMVVDDERQVLYTLSSRGWICVLDIAEAPKVTLTAVLDTATTARLYLEAVSRGKMYPPQTYNQREGILKFPGGGEAAQAGVGGMEGARNILKLAETNKSSRRRSPSNSILTPVCIEVVPNKESTRITLVAVTAGGIRYYLSSLTPNTLNAGPSQVPFGTPRYRSPWKPHTKLTLCHVRAPPSMDEKMVSTTSHLPSVSKDHRVDAACYQMGVYFVAFQKTGGMDSNAGDILVATSPDSMRRVIQQYKKENVAKTTEVAPGGVCEAVSFPMSMGGSNNQIATTLPGGRVWDICPAYSRQHKIMSLALRSKTPTDTELGFGMAPAYVPPSKRRGKEPARKVQRTGPVVASTLVSQSSYNHSMSSVALTVFSNLLFSRPVREGLAVQKPVVKQEERVSLYRVSKRSGSEGYSLSAADTKAKTSGSSRSARLSPWVLSPDVVPLNPLALEHLNSTSKTVISLNAGGLHYFQSPSTLHQLSAAIFAAGSNVKSDPKVDQFFKSYGYAEGCAMCLQLVIHAETSQDHKELALRAAMSRALRPALLPIPTDENSAQPVGQNDPWVPQGYTYTSSALCDALAMVLARLMRPVWHKPAVVVTEGRTLKRGYKSRVTPAKVELLLEDDTIEEVRRPLVMLQQVMSRVFGKAIEHVPLTRSMKSSNDQMDVDDEDNHFFTRALGYQRRGQVQSLSESMLRPDEAELLAQQIEERDIHSFYRLLSRTVQLLGLLSHLRRAHSMPDMPEVEWGLLHGITLEKIVSTKEGQERVESVLNSLITSNDSLKSAVPTPSAEVTQLAQTFADQCYHFFSPGSRYAYIGFKCAQEAMALPSGQSRRAVMVKQAVEAFKHAAKNWYSAPVITGRLLQSGESSGTEEIVQRAREGDSPLAKACDLLVELGDVAAVVDICLLTASNFTGKKSTGMELVDAFPSSSRVHSWEKGLYHRRQEMNTQGNGQGSSALGTNVTSKDGNETCRAIIFYHLSKLLDAPIQTPEYQLGESMVSVCASSSDMDFLHAFFNYLFENNLKDVLLKIDSRDLQKWLVEQKKDQPSLLLRFYHLHGKQLEAAQVAWDRAIGTTQELSLDERVESLVQALDSYAAAMNNMGENQEELTRNKKMVEEKLMIARLQGRILQAMDSTKYEVKEENLLELRSSLLSPNVLFNKYAMPFDMFELCLLLLHVCRHDDASHVKQFWKSLMCDEIFPVSTRSERVFQALREFTDGSLLDNPVISLVDQSSPSSDEYFESGRWMKGLEGRIVALGRDLIGASAQNTFPIDFLISSLEQLRLVYASAGSPNAAKETQGWACSILVAAGVPFMVALTAYDQLVENENHLTMGGVDTNRRREHLQNSIKVLENFVSTARAGLYGNENPAYTEICRAMASGNLQSGLEAFKMQLQALPGDVSEEEERLKAVENKTLEFYR